MKNNNDNLLRDVRKYVAHMKESIALKIEVNDFFQESSYADSIGRTLPCYLVTRKGCEFIANKLTGKKGTIFTAAYINRFHDMENAVAVAQLPTLPADGLHDRLDRLISLLEMQYQPRIEVDSEPPPDPSQPIPKAKHILDREMLKTKKLLTKVEATFYIGISMPALDATIKRSDFPALVRVGFGRGRVFINREKLDQWIDEQDGSRKGIK